MILIAGLGNPGKEYENTRHNAGFLVLDTLAQKLGADLSERKHRALCGKAVIGGQKVILLKPQTYMNSSGESIRAAADYYKVPPEDILVVYDDISLAPGQLRIRAKGSAGGHNGIKSIIAHLGTQEFPRVKVGIGEKPPRMDLADYVLGHFSSGEKKIMEEAAKEAADAICEIVNVGIEQAMNDHNRRKEEQK
ncbi:MAG TPA: aminoacyl-tRNA hydrolase [Candidatus Copromonas avistercoris]|nr:aminoacyl-tRNA hydrolase [Candidatus Copromonas avistercoris]